MLFNGPGLHESSEMLMKGKKGRREKENGRRERGKEEREEGREEERGGGRLPDF